MADRANIKVSREFYEKHNERREEMGRTWEEYIDGQAPELDVGLDEGEMREIVRDEVRAILREELR